MTPDQKIEKDIRLQLMMCSGSEHLYNNPLFRHINFTDGVLTMVELCEANWLLIDMLANITSLKARYEFIVVKILKNQGESKCKMIFEDGDKNEIRNPIDYPFTDFPLSDWQNKENLEPSIIFFFRNDVLYLPSEH